MARNFVAASSQKLSVATAVVSALPISMACWYKPTSVASTLRTLISIDNNVNQGWVLGVNDAAGGNDCRLHVNSTLTSSIGTVAAGTWGHCGGVFTSSISRTAFFNGVSGATSTTSLTPVSVSQTQIGVRFASGNFANGDIAEAAIWNIALVQGDWTSLAAGISPLLIHPESLIFYAPLLSGASPEIELIRANNMTVTGASASTHTRMFYPNNKYVKGAGFTGFPDRYIRDWGRPDRLITREVIGY